jgi:hypothetical protein
MLLESNAGLLQEYFLTCGKQLVPTYTASNNPRRITIWKERVHYTGVGGERTLWETSHWAGCAIHWAGS